MNTNMIQASLPNFMDLMLDTVCLVDAEGYFVYVSPSCERVFGYTPAEMVGLCMFDLILPADLERTRTASNEVLAGQPKTHFENRYIRKDGKVVHIMWTARWSEEDQLRIAVARDITERKHNEHIQRVLYAIADVSNTTEDFITLFEKVHSALNECMPAPHFFIALHDEHSGLQFPFSYRESSKTMPSLNHTTLAMDVARSGNPIIVTPETMLSAAEREHYYLKDVRYCLVYPLKAQQKILGSLVLLSYCHKTHYSEKDLELLQLTANQVAVVIERNKMQARFRYMAQYDHLTGLPNRTLLYDRLKTALERARRQDKKLALLFIDLDKFKSVNDNFGHLAGDHLLQVIAIRLRECIRESDTIARIGGDEFAVLLEGAQTLEQANVVVEKICASLNQPLSYENQRLKILASVGVAFYPDHGSDERQLINHADRSMYTAKRHLNS